MISVDLATDGLLMALAFLTRATLGGRVRTAPTLRANRHYGID